MRLLIQRVKEATVKVENQVCGQIKKGLLVFLGIHKEDSDVKIGWLANKLVTLRIFPDTEGKMNQDIRQVEGDILVVSQFTLYGNCLSGRRPDFIESAGPEIALPLYEKFILQTTEALGKPVQSGKFGALMEVCLINDGPVTFLVER